MRGLPSFVLTVCCLVHTASSQLEVLDVRIDLVSPNYTVSDSYMCVTIDSGVMQEDWKALDLTSPLVVTLAEGLSPITLRVGGTMQDYMHFKPGSSSATETKRYTPQDRVDARKELEQYYEDLSTSSPHNFTVSTHDWDVLNEFVKTVGWELVFGLNDFIMKDWSNGTWNSSNAEELVKYTMEKGYSIYAWEVGNEPDMIKAPYSTLIKPESLVRDYSELRHILEQAGWPNIRLAGPDTATLFSGGSFFKKFLNGTKAGSLHAVTYHQYYMASETATKEDFVDISLLDKFLDYSLLASVLVQNFHPDSELWLGETSSSYDGGARDLSNAYIAGFMWLDKLGLAALRNHTKVFRQSFYGGFYGLLYFDYTPTPDYWLSLLYRRLVGPVVLSVLDGVKHDRSIRIYAHCVRPSDRYKQGGVVMYALNLLQAEASLSLSNGGLSGSHRDVYWLEPGDESGLLSKYVALNGKRLAVVNNTTLPDLPPKEETASKTLSLPPMSFGFVVFKDSNAMACEKNSVS